MQSVTPSRASGLDALRAVAILAVMLFHLLGVLPESLSVVGQYGWMGVDLFFVLSGYLIGSQLLKPYVIGESPSVLGFYRRRLFRILPAYLVVVALYATVPGWREVPGFGPVWKFLTFTENLLFDPDYHAFSHAWSLCVEEHFYLVLPLLVVWMMKRPSARRTALLMSGVMLLGVLLRGFAITHVMSGGWNYFKYIYYPTCMRLDGLLVGVMLGAIRAFRPAWWDAVSNRGHHTFAAGLIFVGAVMWMFRNDGLGEVSGSAVWGTVLGYPLLAFGLGLIVASSISRNGVLSRFAIPGTRSLATLAFSLYLTHKAIVHIDRTYLPSLTAERDLRAMGVYFASCVVAAAILYVCVERPFMLLRDRGNRRPVKLVEEEMLEEPAGVR